MLISAHVTHHVHTAPFNTGLLCHTRCTLQDKHGVLEGSITVRGLASLLRGTSWRAQGSRSLRPVVALRNPQPPQTSRVLLLLRVVDTRSAPACVRALQTCRRPASASPQSQKVRYKRHALARGLLDCLLGRVRRWRCVLVCVHALKPCCLQRSA